MYQFNRSDRILPFVCILLVSLLPLTGCATRDARTDLMKSSSSVPQTYAGSPVSLSLTVSHPSIRDSEKVEVTLEQVVPESLSDHDISSAKIELPATFKNNSLKLEIPTTESFKPGIWHVSELRFYSADKKAWVACKAGVDFTGLAFRLINTSDAASREGKLRLDTVEMVSQ